MRTLCSLLLQLLVLVFLMMPATAQTAPKPKAKTRTAAVTAQDLPGFARRIGGADQRFGSPTATDPGTEAGTGETGCETFGGRPEQQLQQAQATAAEAQSKAAAVESVASDGEDLPVAKL